MRDGAARSSSNKAKPSNVRISLVNILTFDGFFGTKFDILKPRWLPTPAKKAASAPTSGSFGNRAQDGNICCNSGLVGAELGAASRAARRLGATTGGSPSGSAAGVSSAKTSSGSNRTMPKHNPRRRFVIHFGPRSAALVFLNICPIMMAYRT